MAPEARAADPQYLELLDVDLDSRPDMLTTTEELGSLGVQDTRPTFISVAYGGHSVSRADLTLTVDCGGGTLVPGRVRSGPAPQRSGPQLARDVVLTSGPQPDLLVTAATVPAPTTCTINAAGISFPCSAPSLAAGSEFVVTLGLTGADLPGTEFELPLQAVTYASTATGTTTPCSGDKAMTCSTEVRATTSSMEDPASTTAAPKREPTPHPPTAPSALPG